MVNVKKYDNQSIIGELKKTVTVLHEYTIKWIAENFTNGKEFVASRNKYGMKIPTCFYCKKSLDVDEPLHLVGFDKHKNELYHNDCLELALVKEKK